MSLTKRVLKQWHSVFKVIQVRNCIESYTETKIKPAKADILPQTPYKASAAAQSYHSEP